MKNKKLNNKGLGRKETMMGLLLIVIFMVILLSKVVGTKDKGNYVNFRRAAMNFAEAAGRMRNEEIGYETDAYLVDAIELDYISEVKSPFDSKEKCDVYESKIHTTDNSVLVTLHCSDYLIYNEATTVKEFTIYKVSDWSSEKIVGDNVQTEVFYNYSEDGKEQLDKYYSVREFLDKYKEKTGKEIRYVNSLDSNQKLLEKTYYRTLEKVE